MMWNKEVVADLLRKEEARRRRAVAERDEKIVALMAAEVDSRGKLWREDSFEGTAARYYGSDGCKWPTDAEALFLPDVDPLQPSPAWQPERALEVADAARLAEKVIGDRWGKRGIRLFRTWLQMPVREVSGTTGVPLRSVLSIIREMVEACRLAAGSPPGFPFPEEANEVEAMAQKMYQQKAAKRRLDGSAAAHDAESRVYLAPDEREMLLGALCAHIERRYGCKVSRATAWRAKKSGYFMKPGFKRGGALPDLIRFALTDEERLLPRREIETLLGCACSTAKEIRRRGWFSVDSRNRDRLRASGVLENRRRV